MNIATRISCATLAFAACASTALATAQTAQSPTVSVVAVPVTTQDAGRILSTNTPITLAALEEISSSGLQVGTRVRFSVAEDVVSKGMIVIPRGALASGTVTWKTGKAIGGKSGKFEVTFDEVMVNNNRIRLMGKHRQEGRGNTLAAVLGSMVVSGRSAVMLPGQQVQALTAEPVSF